MELTLNLLALLRLPMGCQVMDSWQPGSSVFATTTTRYQRKHRRKRSC
jgi:hypothetical protein